MILGVCPICLKTIGWKDGKPCNRCEVRNMSFLKRLYRLGDDPFAMIVLGLTFWLSVGLTLHFTGGG